MLIKEYRIPLPLSVDEYKVAQLYMIAKKSKEETQGTGSGVEILVNEPYDDGPGGSGQYTHKIYHVGYHLPGWLKALLPKSALIVEEEAWNAYPYTKTRYTCPFVEKFFIEIETKYFDDCGCRENVFDLNNSELRSRVVGKYGQMIAKHLISVLSDVIDIVKDQLYSSDYKREEDPKIYVSQKTGRGPLNDNWVEEYWKAVKSENKKKDQNIMCAYKLCRVEFKYWGMQTKIEKFIHDSALRKTMVRAHKQAWTWQDEWVDLTMADIRKLEKETQEYLRTRMSGNNELAINETLDNPQNSNTEIDLNVIDKDNDNYEEIIAMEVPRSKSSTSHPSLASKQSTSKEQDLGDGRRKLWSRSNSQSGFSSPGEYDLQIANWKMESIVKEPESSSDDEFYDAEEMPNISPLTKWSSLEYIPSDFASQREQSVDATDDSDNIFSETYIKRLQTEHSKHPKTAFMNRNSVDTTSLPSSPTHLTPCPTDTLILILHGGSLLDAGNDPNSSKTSDITTFRSSLESVVRQHYPRLNGRIAFRLVSCPAICSDALIVLSSLSPYSFQASPSAIDGVYHTFDAIPIGALPLFAVSSQEYHENVSKVISATNHTYSEFLKSEEGLGFCGQISLIGDNIGSIIAFDALCRSNSCGSHFGSETSIPDLSEATQRSGDPSQTHSKPVLTPRQYPLISISDGSGNEDTDETSGTKTSHKAKTLPAKSNTGTVNRPYLKSHSHPGETPDESVCNRLLTAPMPRRRSSCSSDQSCCHRFDFEVTDFFMFGSPLGLVLTFRKMLAIDDKTYPLPKPTCTHLYNLFHPTDPSVLRIEPLLSARFSHIPPVNVARYQKYPLGDGLPIHLLEYLQTYSHLFTNDAPQLTHTYPSIGRRASEVSITSNMSLPLDSLTLPNISSLTQKWWGTKRLDYALYCPEGLNNFPAHALPHLFHASYWESYDVISFILRQISRIEYMSASMLESEKESQSFTPCQPREKWQKKRTSVKLKNVNANHRANDVIVKEGSTQVISARFMYGPLDVVALSGEKVDIHIMKNIRSGEWTYLSTEFTDKTGRVSYTIPEDKTLTYGLYPVKIVVRGDHTSIDFYLAVVPPKTEAVVFSIDGSFTASMSVTGKDPKVRAGAVDVVRYWQELGYLIIYITGRPDMQQQRVISWLSQHNFPHGLVSFADRLSTDALRHKAEHLRHLQNETEIIFQAAYGSSKDIAVYQSLGLKPEQIYIVGKVSKKQQSMANILSDGYAAHLNELIGHGLSRPAQGNARMVLPRGGFGGVRHRRSTKAKRTISYPLTSQTSVSSVSPMNMASNTAPVTTSSESTSYGFFSSKSFKSNK